VVQGKCIRATIEDKRISREIQRQARWHDRVLAPTRSKAHRRSPVQTLSDDDLAKLSDYQIPGDRPPFRFADFLETPAIHQDLNSSSLTEKSDGRY